MQWYSWIWNLNWLEARRLHCVPNTSASFRLLERDDLKTTCKTVFISEAPPLRQLRSDSREAKTLDGMRRVIWSGVGAENIETAFLWGERQSIRSLNQILRWMEWVGVGWRRPSKRAHLERTQFHAIQTVLINYPSANTLRIEKDGCARRCCFDRRLHIQYLFAQEGICQWIWLQRNKNDSVRCLLNYNL